MNNNITIIDYGMGNLRSIQRRFEKIGIRAEITSDTAIIEQADKLILPGVGHFANGVMQLKKSGIWEILNNKVLIDKIPILGICLGMQLMASSGEEGNTEGLGWFDAKVIKFRTEDKLKYKIPHMGWNTIIQNRSSQLLENVSNDSMYYFAHSYYIECNDSVDILTRTVYEKSFTSAVQKENIYGTQFHPEKSHDNGELILRNFLSL
jgi:imidazole glycerol-phosphate synthase subunit HisH